MPVSSASPIEFGVSVQALPLQGINPARKEDQLNRADCREGFLIFEAANWLERCDAIRSGGSSSTKSSKLQKEPNPQYKGIWQGMCMPPTSDKGATPRWHHQTLNVPVSISQLAWQPASQLLITHVVRFGLGNQQKRKETALRAGYKRTRRVSGMGSISTRLFVVHPVRLSP